MAFNKGLQLVDSNSVVRDSIALQAEATAPTFFQSQLVDSTVTAHGATVFTIRPDTGAAGEYIEIVVGQNFAVGIEYNAGGDQYRLVVQSRDAYDAGAGTTTPAYGAYVDAEVETTFGVNLNANGTLTYMHTGSAAQTLSIPSFNAEVASVVLEESATPDGSDVAHLILDDGRGNIVEVFATSSGTADGNLSSEIKDAFDAAGGLTLEQRSGFEMSLANTDEITITRADGAGFKISAGETNNISTATLQQKTTAVAIATGIDASAVLYKDYDAGGTDDIRQDFFDRDYDGFVSQFAEFNAPLTISELSGYVNQPATIPETLVNTDGSDAVALITAGSSGVEDSILYQLDLDDTNGHAISISFTTDASATFAELVTGLKASFDALDDDEGYSLDDSVTGQLKISRADGADFEVDTSNSANTGANQDLLVNGVILDASDAAADSALSSTSIVSSSLSIEEIADPVAGSTAGTTYEIVLEADDGTSLTVNAFVLSTDITADDALDDILAGAGGAGTYSGFTFGSVLSNAIEISRADGQNFTIKLGANDEAANIEVSGTALTKDATVATTNGVRSGEVDTISNKVIQNFDFTTLSDSVEVVGKATANYAGETTLQIMALDKSDGPDAEEMLQMSASDANAYDGVDATGYTGAVAVSSGDAISADVLYIQLRDVEDETSGRELTADIFIDPYLITDGDFGALSFNVAWDSDLTLTSLSQLDATGGYKLDDVQVGSDTADLRWFKPTAVTDFSTPVATLVFDDDAAAGDTDPTFTFTSVDIDGTDFTDGTTYANSFTSSKAGNLWDQVDTLSNGLDGSTAVADQLVIVSAAPGGSATVPNPTSGLYLVLDAYDTDASTDDPAVDYTLGVYSSTATNDVSFEIELPALADVSVDAVTLLNNTTFTLDAALADWNLTSVEVQGRTLVVEASGVTNLAVGDSIGQLQTTINSGFDTTQYFNLTNVQTDADAANENGRGLYVAATRTDEDGEWSVSDLPTGIMTRAYVGTAETPANAISALDAYYALQISAGLVPNWYSGSAATQGQMIAADFDGSGKVTAADALAILNYSVGNVPTPDPVQWAFFDDETTGLTVTTVDDVEALAANIAISSSSTSGAPLAQGDEVVLVGDLSDPAA
ncbi:hypothetical protein N9W46_00060 [Litoricolaceae bacterium]|nr:hypothetical protein [Litorivicinaceae bacterium]